MNNFISNHIDGTIFEQPCLPFLIQNSNFSLKGCAHFYKSIKKAKKGKLGRKSNNTVNFGHMKTCFRLCNKTAGCTYLRYIQFKILHNRLVTQTLLRKMGKSESESCLYSSKERDTQVHALLYCSSIIQLWSNVETWVRVHD